MSLIIQGEELVTMLNEQVAEMKEKGEFPLRADTGHYRFEMNIILGPDDKPERVKLYGDGGRAVVVP